MSIRMCAINDPCPFTGEREKWREIEQERESERAREQERARERLYVCLCM